MSSKFEYSTLLQGVFLNIFESNRHILDFEATVFNREKIVIPEERGLYAFCQAFISATLSYCEKTWFKNVILNIVLTKEAEFVRHASKHFDCWNFQPMSLCIIATNRHLNY